MRSTPARMRLRWRRVRSPSPFGDFQSYWIADRTGRTVQRLNELYSTNGQVGFVATERVDGKIILPEGIQLLKMKAA